MNHISAYLKTANIVTFRVEAEKQMFLMSWVMLGLEVSACLITGSKCGMLIYKLALNMEISLISSYHAEFSVW